MQYNSPTTYLSFEPQFTGLNHFLSCRFVVKTPSECVLAELYHFYLLLKKGNKVSLVNLHEKISQCALLGFCYSGDRLVGISAIKRPAKSYIEQIHHKAGVVRNTAEFGFEVGYSYTETDVRRHGISTRLKDVLQHKISHHKGVIFATTAVPSSQHFLISRGFKPMGKPYQGFFDDAIVYFEKRMY